jgi:superfamily II DNA or RNA helicase
MGLRPYQEKAICSSIDLLAQGVSKQLLIMATGTGKTKVAISLIERHGFKKVLFITHTEELAEQSGLAFLKDKFDEDFANKVKEEGFINWASRTDKSDQSFKMGIIKAQHFNLDGSVIVASAQTLWRRLDRIDFNEFQCVIADEVHLFLSKTFEAPLRYFKPKLLLGLTATPTRLDGLSLSSIFERIIFEYNIGQAIKDKNLCELDAIRIKTDISLDNVKTLGGELNVSELTKEVNIPKRNRLIVESYLKYAKGRKGIFFCVDQQHSVDLAEMFNEYDVKCKPFVSDKDITVDRSKTFLDFTHGDTMVLTNVTILSTGVDFPNIGCIGNAAPTKSLARYMQGIGRGTRKKDEEYVKKFGQACIVIDCVDSSSRHKLINTWTLDQGLATEDKIFMTSAKKQELIDARLARQAQVENLHTQDKVIQLIQLPEYVFFKYQAMEDPATELQIKWISALGWDTVNNTYTKEQCNQIIKSQPARKHELEYLKERGYETNGATIGNYDAVIKLEYKKKNYKKVKK